MEESFLIAWRTACEGSLGADADAARCVVSQAQLEQMHTVQAGQALVRRHAGAGYKEAGGYVMPPVVILQPDGQVTAPRRECREVFPMSCLYVPILTHMYGVRGQSAVTQRWQGEV